MKTKANEVLVEMLEKASQGIDNSVLFLQEQVPEVASQVLSWHLLINSSLFLLCFAVAIFIGVVSIKWWESDPKNPEEVSQEEIEDITGSQILSVLSGLVSGVLVAISIHYLFVVIKIVIAPKLYLLEYVAGLVK